MMSRLNSCTPVCMSCRVARCLELWLGFLTHSSLGKIVFQFVTTKCVFVNR